MHGPMKTKAKRVTEGRGPSTVNGKVPPRRLPNAERRPREYLTPEEVERLMTAAQKRIGARNPHRDATMILLAFRHGLRASELCSLRWDMLDLAQGRYHVTRRKNGRPSVHLLRGTEIRALRRLQREQVPQSIYVFTTERRGPMTPATFRKLLDDDRRRRPSSPSPSTRTCCGTPAATSSPTTATTPAPCRNGSGTPTSRTRRGTPSSPAGGSRISGSRRIKDVDARVGSGDAVVGLNANDTGYSAPSPYCAI